ncbi:MAG TPA: hypothetical protein ENJ08_15715 [Gammaproteobacteria bacterium]|nr:hypothetical protein [Gammaproteobacteria bacterium]
MSNSIDFKFISKLEGGSKTKGYVPAAGVSKSGVTIATGFDLGARSESDINKMSISATLRKKLKPYAGKQKQDAVKYLKNNPFTITPTEAASTDNQY